MTITDSASATRSLAMKPTATARLADHIRAVRTGSDLILLDLAADDYLCLPDCPDLRIQRRRISGPAHLMFELGAAGILAGHGDDAVCLSPPPDLPLRSLPAVHDVRTRGCDLLDFAWIWLQAAGRRRTLDQLSHNIAGRSGRRDDLEAIARRVEVFRRLLPFAPGTGACLFQAELLLAFLNAAGLDADWVVGVRTWPFLAHCWLQVGDTCVSDAPETLIVYRPITVL